MKKAIGYFILMLIFGSSFLTVHGESEPCKDENDTSYECYKKNVGYYCDEGGPWEKNGFLSTDIPTEKYPEMTSKSIQDKKKDIENYAKNNGKEVYTPPVSIYQLDILSVSHQIYHTQMNSLFTCAMISSRINIAKTVIDTINKQFGTKSSEITRKIESLNKKLDKLRPKSCKGTTDAQDKAGNIIPMRLRLLDSASFQYCTYRYYLEYLEKNVNSDFAKVQKEMNDFRKTTSGALMNPKDTAQLAYGLDSLNREISREIDAAKRTYPVAIAAYVEMERTYSIHLLLQFIQSDYLDLRKNLRDLLNPISQLFYKVMNAQSANKG